MQNSYVQEYKGNLQAKNHLWNRSPEGPGEQLAEHK